MADEPKVDIRKVLDEGAQRTTLEALAQKGFRNVRVLDERTVGELIVQAVEKAVTTRTAEEKARIVAESRRELDRLMRERNEFMTKAGMLEAGRNELIQQIETLQNELRLRRQIEEEGEAGFRAQLKEIVERHREFQERIRALEEEKAGLQDRLRAVEEEAARRGEELRRAQAELAELESLRRELDEARSALAAAEREKAERERLLQEARAREEDVRRELESVRREADSQKARNQELEARLRKPAPEATPVPARKPAAKGRKDSSGVPPPPPAAAPAVLPPAPVAAAPPPPPPPRPSPARPDRGKGLDIGTVNLVAAEQDEKGEVRIRLMRNAFLDIACDASMKSTLTRLKVPYVEQGDKFYVLGESAFEMANALGRNTRRPMKDGLISPREVDALPVMKLLIGSILGPPRSPGEICFYSVPGQPIDSDISVVYHKDLFDAVLRALGYEPHHIVEGHAVVFAELGEEDFSGIGISCGGGMFNVCVAYKSMPALSFSTSRGGDWIDQNVASALGIKPARVAYLKEKGVDLVKPKNREEDAIGIFYRDLIQYTLTNIRDRFLAAEHMPSFPHPVTLVFSGGTSLAGGFIELAQSVLRELDFPIPIKEVRLARDPLHATAKGCLAAALLEGAGRGA